MTEIVYVYKLLSPYCIIFNKLAHLCGLFYYLFNLGYKRNSCTLLSYAVTQKIANLESRIVVLHVSKTVNLPLNEVENLEFCDTLQTMIFGQDKTSFCCTILGKFTFLCFLS